MIKNQKGFILLLLVVVVVIVVTLISGLLYYSWQKGLIKTTSNTSSFSPTPTKTVDETVNWKTYEDKDFGIRLRYPNHWYYEEYEGTGTIDFFLVETPADHSFGDHKGTEIFSVSPQDDNRTLEEIENNYYKDAISVEVSGKPAIKTSFNLYIVKPRSNQLVHIMAGMLESEELTDQILSTFRFSD